MQLYNTIQHEPLRFPASPEISPQLRDLLTCLLQKDPSARITMPDIFQHPWVTLGANLPLYSLQVRTQFQHGLQHRVAGPLLPQCDCLLGQETCMLL